MTEEANESPPSADPRAMAEWSRLESIVSRQSELAFKTRSWLIALLTALLIGVFTGRISIAGHAYWVISYGLAVSFFLMEAIQRVPQSQALRRIARIEEHLRGERDYDGPRICIDLPLRLRVLDLLQEARTHIMWLPYLMIAIVVFLFGVFAR